MRIAQVMLDRTYGGLQRNFLDHCEEFARRDCHVLAVVRKNSYAETQLTSSDSLHVASIRNDLAYHDPLAKLQLSSSLNRFKPDIVGTYGSRATFLSGKANSAGNWPIIASLPNAVNNKYYRNANALLPSSEEIAQVSHHKNMPAHEPRFVEVIPHFSRLRPVLSVARRNKIHRIFTVARLVQKKGVDVLLAAAGRLLAEGFDIRLDIAGDGPEAGKLKKLCADLDIADSVKFLGKRDDIPELLNRSDLFALPSRIEPFGIVLLEAMSQGIPIVATRTMGPNSIFDNNSAVLVDAGNVLSLSDGIAAVISDPSAACDRATHALELFRRVYCADAVMPKVLSLYERLIQEHRSF